MSLEQQFFDQDKALLPTNNVRRSKEWMKRKLGKNEVAAQRPGYCFTVVCSGIPQDIRVGESIQFAVALLPNLELGAPDIEDKVFLDRCTVTLSTQIRGCPPMDFEILRQEVNDYRPRGPFSKDSGYIKTINLGVLSHLPAKSESCELHLEFVLRVADMPITMRCDFSTIMHPSAMQVSNLDACGQTGARCNAGFGRRPRTRTFVREVAE